MKHISVQAFKEVLAAEGSNPTVDFINVCTPAEYQESHINGVRSVPLDEIDRHAREFDGKKTVYVHCRSGRRAERAIERLRSLGVTAELVNVEGGIMAWQQAGFETGSSRTGASSNRLPVMRQTFIAAGALILAANLLYIAYGPYALVLSAAVGAGLLFAGLTGRCGMAFALAKMPWNR